MIAQCQSLRCPSPCEHSTPGCLDLPRRPKTLLFFSSSISSSLLALASPPSCNELLSWISIDAQLTPRSHLTHHPTLQSCLPFAARCSPTTRTPTTSTFFSLALLLRPRGLDLFLLPRYFFFQLNCSRPPHDQTLYTPNPNNINIMHRTDSTRAKKKKTPPPRATLENKSSSLYSSS